MTWVLDHLPARDEWEKRFEKKDDAVAELRTHICEDCLQGRLGYVDSSAPGGVEYEQKMVPDAHSATDLLATPCGMEFNLYEESAASPESSAA